MLDQQMYTLEQIEVVKFHSSDVSEKRIYDHFSILITIGGKGEFRIEDKRYGLNQTGQVFFCNPGTELYYTILKVQMLFQEILHLLWKGHEESKLEKSENVIEKITTYIEEHYDEDLTRDQLANMAGIS